MAIDVVMPRLGWTMEEGTLVDWLKSPGDAVAAGDLLFTVESDKALNEIESMDTGTLHIPSNAPTTGDVVPVGAVIGYLLADGEQGPAEVPPPPAVTGASGAAASSATATATATAEAAASTSSPTPGKSVPISPRARKLAKELGVHWESLSGSGSTGRITEDDIRTAAQNAAAAGPAPQSDGGQLASTESITGERTPMSPLRRAIAERLSLSHRDGAPVTLTAELDATDLVELRERTKPRPAFNDYLIRYVATALDRHPALNTSLSGADVVQREGIHIGFAVDTDKGLLVPVIRDADGKSVEQIARESSALSGRALRGELTGDKMTGGTFTITNLGAAGIDAFTPIVNPPQGAILGVGRIAQRPAVHDGQIVVRWLCVVSLTFDHRIVDGGPAARFLATLRQMVEAPASS
jgi:pyruvate dehydrogenase E2 component (dihydrolipoamide acetyltransferase)